jgi:hypothetical protein
VRLPTALVVWQSMLIDDGEQAEKFVAGFLEKDMGPAGTWMDFEMVASFAVAPDVPASEMGT